ncbi:MAG TPA: helix-hairpin-helix domain-containing protein [Coriobacteriia bacterium]|nr:helix-hairpin-helix domain-containing protein [Coriobacteriia bacterium]
MPVFEEPDSTRPRRSLAELASLAGLAGVPRAALAGLLVLTVAAVALTAWKLASQETGGEFAFSAGAASSRAPGAQADGMREGGSHAATLWVHVAGAVSKPGLFELPAGARVGDALTAAGGLRPDAIADSVNLARPLRDGEQVYVPSESEAGAEGGAASTPGGSAVQQGAGASPGQGIDINRASVAELEALPGVGPATAERIVADREANGPFISPEDLMRVPGIGEKKFEAMAEMVVVR